MKRPDEIQLVGLGRCEFPSGSGRSQAAKRFLLRYDLKSKQFVGLIHLIYLVAVVTALPLGPLAASSFLIERLRGAGWSVPTLDFSKERRQRRKEGGEKMGGKEASSGVLEPHFPIKNSPMAGNIIRRKISPRLIFAPGGDFSGGILIMEHRFC